MMQKKLPPGSTELALHTGNRSPVRVHQSGVGWRADLPPISVEVTSVPASRLDKNAVASYQLDNTVLPYSKNISINLVKALEIARKRKLRVLLQYGVNIFPDGTFWEDTSPYSGPVQGYICNAASGEPELSQNNPDTQFTDATRMALFEECLLKVECADSADGDVLWEASADHKSAAARMAETAKRSKQRAEISYGAVAIMVILIVVALGAWGVCRLIKWL